MKANPDKFQDIVIDTKKNSQNLSFSDFVDRMNTDQSIHLSLK
jgi:aminopeptidase-like protein